MQAKGAMPESAERVQEVYVRACLEFCFEAKHVAKSPVFSVEAGQTVSANSVLKTLRLFGMRASLGSPESFEPLRDSGRLLTLGWPAGGQAWLS